MKTKVILKSLLDIMLFIAAVTLLEAIFNLLGVFIEGFPTLLLNDDVLENNNTTLKSFVILSLINQLLFFVCILFLRKIAKIYRDQKSVYQLKILQYLSISGWCLFIFSGLEILVRGLEFYMGDYAVHYSGIASTQKSALLAVLAILMIRLSKIFKKTVEQKKENEFTI
jgi:hypothetical protein